ADADDDRAADDDRYDVALQIAVLQVLGELAEARDDEADTVDEQEVDDDGVERLPQHEGGVADRAHDEEVVDLVDVELVEHQLVEAGEGRDELLHARRDAVGVE